MLERYYYQPKTIDRIRANWLAPSIERYVEWMEKEGYSPRNFYRRVPILCHFGDYAQKNGAQSLEQAALLVEAFAKDWLSKHPPSNGSPLAAAKIMEDARNPVNQMFRLVVPNYTGGGRHTKPDPFRNEAPGFFTYLSQEKGLKPSTLFLYRHYLIRFSDFLSRQGILSLKEISVATLSAFVVDVAPNLSPNSRRNLCGTVKVFLRYCHRENILPNALEQAVEMPQAYRLATLPRAIGWEDVRRMLDQVDRRSVKGRRDYAILLLLVTYGLRAHEVAALTLEDIDWQRDRLLVPERKAGHSTAYPLAGVVGKAILDYLQHGRPKTEDRHLFFRVLAPIVPIQSSAVSSCVVTYLHKAGITVYRAGSHTLRHTCVQHLVDADFPLKTVGDYVGHRSPSSTAIYTKIATEALREVAMGDGEAL
ncbi:MAG: tyrosine-type recombinase/integrase [Leptospirillum sp.]